LSIRNFAKASRPPGNWGFSTLSALCAAVVIVSTTSIRNKIVLFILTGFLINYGAKVMIIV
jgi:hypothetical protein